VTAVTASEAGSEVRKFGRLLSECSLVPLRDGCLILGSFFARDLLKK
jgi:hypothetical protein